MNRQQKRAAARKLKKEQGRINKVNQAVAAMPTKCDECSAPFDSAKTSDLDAWKVAVYDDGPVHLICPNCVPDDVGR